MKQQNNKHPFLRLVLFGITGFFGYSIWVIFNNLFVQIKEKSILQDFLNVIKRQSVLPALVAFVFLYILAFIFIKYSKQFETESAKSNARFLVFWLVVIDFIFSFDSVVSKDEYETVISILGIIPAS